MNYTSQHVRLIKDAKKTGLTFKNQCNFSHQQMINM